jgi:hypothetical protein
LKILKPVFLKPITLYNFQTNNENKL